MRCLLPRETSVVLHRPGRLHYAENVERPIRPDPQSVFVYDASSLENGQLAE
jgi:hypothetical protein